MICITFGVHQTSTIIRNTIHVTDCWSTWMVRLPIFLLYVGVIDSYEVIADRTYAFMMKTESMEKLVDKNWVLHTSRNIQSNHLLFTFFFFLSYMSRTALFASDDFDVIYRWCFCLFPELIKNNVSKCCMITALSLTYLIFAQPLILWLNRLAQLRISFFQVSEMESSKINGMVPFGQCRFSQLIALRSWSSDPNPRKSWWCSLSISMSSMRKSSKSSVFSSSKPSSTSSLGSTWSSAKVNVTNNETKINYKEEECNECMKLP